MSVPGHASTIEEEVIRMSVVVHHFGLGTTGQRSPERRTFGRKARRTGLAVFFASVVVNAAIGIYGILAPDFGDTEQKILVTSLCVTGALLMALSCEPAWERRLLGQAPAAGALLGAAAFAGLIVGIWTEPESEALRNVLWSTFSIAIACTIASLLELERTRTGISRAHERVLTATLALIALGAAVAVTLIWAEPSEDTVSKVAASWQIIMAGCIVAAFLTLARLARPHEWVLGVTLGLLAVGAGMLAGMPWLEGDPNEFYVRGMGVVLVAFAAFAVTVPVLHWIDRGARAVEAVSDAIRYCPHCGQQLAGEVGVELACGRCGREFTVTRNVST
jgi:hypothetical protein